ncbi:MAG: MYXO-CTERM sorting domain-containing protein [Polyangiaceae bacterium]|nr:MYXO-CTERM sorting domain-containing protein [Polyangiaceae bacterium]
MNAAGLDIEGGCSTSGAGQDRSWGGALLGLLGLALGRRRRRG